jgi:hypothetical protein
VKAGCRLNRGLPVFLGQELVAFAKGFSILRVLFGWVYPPANRCWLIG